MNNYKDILAIDDEEIILDAISKIISFEGYTLDVCTDVDSAISKMKKHHYRLIICDIMMPEKDGFEFLQYVNTNRINTPVVITTGFSTLENAVKSLYEGAIGFIPKPFTVEELLSITKRGLHYGENFNRCYYDISTLKLDFIPCPPKYYRLGFDSWMFNVSEGIVKIGITDLFLKSIGMIKNLEFLSIEEMIYQGGTCLKIIDNENCYHQMLSPISGRIISINNDLVLHQNLLEKDPYFNGWIYKMIPSNIEHELKNITPCSSDI